jgi:uncharacterized iron-regulated protein
MAIMKAIMSSFGRSRFDRRSNRRDRVVHLALLALAGLLAAGCRSALPTGLLEQTGGAAALYGQFQAYDGATGTPLTFAEVAARARAADVVLFGEEHNQAVCSQFQAQLFAALYAAGRPLALALEFIEADTQSSLDAYLNGRIAEADFRIQARQKPAYVLSHRPLVEFCKSKHIPVIAANAPRRLVRAYRLSDQLYADFRAAQPPEEQRWLPRRSELTYGDYFARFVEVMDGPVSHTNAAEASGSQPAAGNPSTSAPGSPRPEDVSYTIRQIYRSQLLWDDAMAEAVADFRARHPARRVMLLVGRFHVEAAGALTEKLRERRPQDRLLRIIWRATDQTDLALAPDARGIGEVVVHGLRPPRADAAATPAQPPPPPANGTATEPSADDLSHAPR